MRAKPLNRVALPALLALLLAFGCIGNAQANGCRVTGAVAFGAYDPTSSANLDTTGSVNLDCDGKFSAVLNVGLGNGAGASYSGGRKMTGAAGPATLTYNLYANAARTQVLGDGTRGSVTLAISGKKAYTQAIWARLPGGQLSVPAGSYNDIVVLTISY